MGKVRRLRQKYHNSVNKDAEKEEEAISPISNVPHLVPVIDKAEEATMQNQNIFAGLQIKLDLKEPSAVHAKVESDRMSVASSTGFQKVLSKRTKRQQRKEAFLKKIDTIRIVEKEQKERKIRAKTAIIGDVHLMLDALPSLEEVVAASHKNSNPYPKKIKSTKKQKQATKDMMSDLQMFVTVNRDPEFQRDPVGAVSRAVKNRILFEEEANKDL